MGVIKDHRDEKINGTWSLVNICGRGMSDDSSEMKLWITYQFKKDLCSPVLFLKVTRIGSGDRLEFNAELKQLKAAASGTRDSEYNTLGKAMMFCARFLKKVVTLKTTGGNAFTFKADINLPKKYELVSGSRYHKKLEKQAGKEIKPREKKAPDNEESSGAQTPRLTELSEAAEPPIKRRKPKAKSPRVRIESEPCNSDKENRSP